MNKSMKGFHVVELVVVVVVVAAVALIGYAVWNGNQKKDEGADTSQQTTSEIKDEKDLDTAASTVDELDAAEGETDLNSLEQELNAL